MKYRSRSRAGRSRGRVSRPRGRKKRASFTSYQPMRQRLGRRF